MPHTVMEVFHFYPRSLSCFLLLFSVVFDLPSPPSLPHASPLCVSQVSPSSLPYLIHTFLLSVSHIPPATPLSVSYVPPLVLLCFTKSSPSPSLFKCSSLSHLCSHVPPLSPIYLTCSSLSPPFQTSLLSLSSLFACLSVSEEYL